MVVIDLIGATINQHHLEAAVRALFNGERILTNARKEAHIKKPTTGFFLELDLWIPDHHISFEFQDPYHYSATWDSQIPLATTTLFDDYKLERIHSRGETLVRVPYWWDGKHESLVATIRFLRPDLLVDSATFPTPLNPSFDSSQPGIVPDIGELMLASFPMSKSFHASVSTEEPWWMGEKYDGIRIVWNPDRNALFTRAGYYLQVPPQFESSLVDSFVDGELWCGRGCFSESQGMLQAHVDSVSWDYMRLVGFDDPSFTSWHLIFEKRYANLLESVPNDHSFVIVASRFLCTNKKHLSYAVEKIVEDEGEGVILRKPKSLYEHGRSNSLLKVKAVRGDKEAMVVAVEPDGSCMLKLPSGIVFRVDPSNVSDDVITTIKEGEVVTFSFENFSRKSFPVKPFIYRIRSDLSWPDVLSLSSSQQTLNETSQKASTGGYRMGEGKKERRKKMRLFFEKFARKRNLDPLLAETWYQVSRKAVINTQGSNPIISHFKGSLIRALVNLFPELELDQSKFLILPQNFWGNVDNRRNFFIKLAHHKNFSPLVVDNWYKITNIDVHSRRGSTSVLSHYGGHFTFALVHLFPELHFNLDLFTSMPYNTHKNVFERRKLFDSYALDNRFDPLIAANWYNIRRRDLLKMKGARTTLRLRKSNCSLRKLLPHLYPEVKFMDSYFADLPMDYWQKEHNQRKFFENYASLMSFDPLFSTSWYPFLPHLQTTKGYQSAIYFHDKNLYKALKHLFPEVAWDWRKFSTLPNFWNEPSNRREALISFAFENKFDALVPAHWYLLRKEDFSEFPDIKSLLQHHDGKLSHALIHLFPTVPFDADKFLQKPNDYWKVAKNRREFFSNFAKVRGVDPLTITNWRNVTLHELTTSKGGNSILRMFNGSIESALKDAYPELDWDSTSDASNNKWAIPHNRRIFFEKYARSNGFDPLLPHNWYSVTYDSLKDTPGALSVLRYYNNSLPAALLRLFPEIDLDIRNFSFTPRNYWNEANNRKKFFTDFASRHMFDAYLPSNWYPVSTASLLNTTGSASILHFYKGSFVKGLRDLFPNMVIDRRLFRHIS